MNDSILVRAIFVFIVLVGILLQIHNVQQEPKPSLNTEIVSK